MRPRAERERTERSGPYRCCWTEPVRTSVHARTKCIVWYRSDFTLVAWLEICSVGRDIYIFSKKMQLPPYGPDIRVLAWTFWKGFTSREWRRSRWITVLNGVEFDTFNLKAIIKYCRGKTILRELMINWIFNITV